MMTISANEFGESLLETIKSKDAQKSMEQVQQFKEMMRDVNVGAAYVLWISEPVNLTRVQQSLTEDLGIPHRALMIRRAQMTRTQKAVLLIQAMEIAIRRAYKL
jgi:hypothetical protein